MFAQGTDLTFEIVGRAERPVDRSESQVGNLVEFAQWAQDRQPYLVAGHLGRTRGPHGVLDLLGRDSVTINSGGEKIFAEEVEAALAGHPDVMDVVVCGRPSERWGNEVVAVVQLRDGADVTTDALEAEAERHVARYKLPKAYVFCERIQRSPSGKADYRWAKAQALDES